MMNFYWLILGVLTVWRISYLLASESGPWNTLELFRHQLGNGFWRELLNSDATEYGGTGMGNMGGVQAEAQGAHGRPFSLKVTLPPLAALFLKAGK